MVSLRYESNEEYTDQSHGRRKDGDRKSDEARELLELIGVYSEGNDG